MRNQTAQSKEKKMGRWDPFCLDGVSLCLSLMASEILPLRSGSPNASPCVPPTAWPPDKRLPQTDFSCVHRKWHMSVNPRGWLQPWQPPRTVTSLGGMNNEFHRFPLQTQINTWLNIILTTRRLSGFWLACLESPLEWDLTPFNLQWPPSPQKMGS